MNASTPTSTPSAGTNILITSTPSMFTNGTAKRLLVTLSLHDALPISVGTAQAAMETTRNYMRERRQFGKTLQEFQDRKSTRLNSSHVAISYAVFCLKKKTTE